MQDDKLMVKTHAFRLLLVEDSKVNQMVIRAMLNKAGYAVEVVDDGLEALQAMQSQHYDLVLMDLAMPEMDGFQAAAEIRQLPGAVSQAPIVAVSAHDLAEGWERCVSAGINDYIKKPIDYARLVTVLSRWLADVGQAGTESERACVSLDGDVLRQLEADTDRTTLQRAVGLFVDDANKRLQAIAAASAAQDWQRLQREAHTLKGSAAMFGARDLERYAQDLDQACRNVDWPRAQVLAEAIAGVAQPALRDLARHYCAKHDD